MITGQNALAQRASGENNHILQWAIPIIKSGNIQNIVDTRLRGEFNIDSARKVVKIAMSCISQTETARPDISQILADLKICLPLDIVQCGITRSRDESVFYTSIESETTILAR